MTFIPSPEQQAIFDAVLNTKDNIAIAALAGTGKSTSLVELSKRLPATGSKIFCAFNKDIVTELEGKLQGTGVRASTFHSIGFSALKKHLNVGNITPQGDKYKKLVAQWAESDGVFALELASAVQGFPQDERAEKMAEIRKDTLAMFVDLLGLARLKLCDWDDADCLKSIIDQYMLDGNGDVPYTLVELVIHNVEYVMKQAEEQTRKLVIDFTDMIYWAVKWNVRFYQYQWVLVDECQDLSPVQREMIDRIIYPRGGRIVLVGDPNQAIYAFAGADSNSFSLSVSRWGCKVLPLTMTRRCAGIITHHASALVPQFRCPDDKARGMVVWLDEDTLAKHVKAGDMVLSRVKAPLAKHCLRLLAENIPATILGDDIGKQAIAMLEKLAKRKDYTFATLLKSLEKYEDEQVSLAQQKGDEAKMEAIKDHCKMVRYIVEANADAPDMDALIQRVDALFTNKKSGDMVIFATAHKSKGLEADRVFILAPDKLPLTRKDMSEEDMIQERNLDYVVRTRAKHTLVYLTSKKYRDERNPPDYAQLDFEEKVWDADWRTLGHLINVASLVGVYALPSAPVEPETPVAVEEPVVAVEESGETMPHTPEVIEADTPTRPYDPEFLEQTSVKIALIPKGYGLFAMAGDTKMFVAHHITEQDQFFVETANGDYIQESLSLKETLTKMEAFSPILSTWSTIPANDWMFATAQHKTMKERKAHAETLAFSKTIHQHLTAMLGIYNPDKGLSADGETTTMYITTDMQNNFVVYESDYNTRDDLTWTRDRKTTNIVALISEMQAINPNTDAWRMIAWGDWIDAEYDVVADETTQDTILEEAEKLGGVLSETPLADAPVIEATPPSEDAIILTKVEETGKDVDEALGLADDTKDSFEDVMRPRLAELVAGSGDGLFAINTQQSIFITIGADESLVIYEHTYGTDHTMVYPAEIEKVLFVMQNTQSDPNLWDETVLDDWYIITRQEKPTAITVEAESTETPPADTPPFSNGESHIDDPATQALLIPAEPPISPHASPEVVSTLAELLKGLEVSELNVIISAAMKIREQKLGEATA